MYHVDSSRFAALRFLLTIALVIAFLCSAVSCTNTSRSSFSNDRELSAVPLEGAFENVVYFSSCNDGFYFVSTDSEDSIGSSSLHYDIFNLEGNIIDSFISKPEDSSTHIILYDSNNQDSLYFLSSKSIDSTKNEYELFCFSLDTKEQVSLMKCELSAFLPLSMAFSTNYLYLLGDDNRLVTIEMNGNIVDDQVMDYDCSSVSMLDNQLLIEAYSEDNRFLLLKNSDNNNDLKKLDAAYLADNSYQSKENSLYYCTDAGIYCTEPISGNTNKVSDWRFMIGRISPDSLTSVIPISDKSFLLKIVNQDLPKRTSFYIATILDKNSSIPPQTITIAGFAISSDPCVLKAVEVFNTSSTSCKAVIRDYYEGVETAENFEMAYESAVRQMKLDVLSGNVFDVFCGDAADIEMLAGSDVYDDLNLYIGGDTEFDKTLYFENAINSVERDGRILYLYPSFGVSGLVGLSSKIGERNSWSLEEFKEIAANQDNAVLALPPMDYSSLLGTLVSSSLHELITFDYHSVSISSSLFTDMLDFSKTYGIPESKLSKTPTSDIEELLENGMILSGSCSILGASYYMRTEIAFGGPVSVANYPSVEKNAPSFNPSKCYAISSGSDQKTEAWRFIKTTMGEEVQVFENQHDNIPVMRSVFEDDIRTAKVDTENGLVSMSEQSAQRYRSLVNNMSGVSACDQRILSIICEESMPYFYEDKSVQDVITIIKSRLEMLLKE